MEAGHDASKRLEVLLVVTLVLGSGLGQAGRVPFGVTAAGIAVVADLLPDSQPVGRVTGLRVSFMPSDSTAGPVPPLIATLPDPGRL